ncbi:MAG: DUF2277 domain-containing protein [Hyphomicrobiaceae bacterium]
MCRNIKRLYNFEPPATDVEIREAAQQFVRKVSGFARPSRTNEVAFAAAIDDVSLAVRKLLASLVTSSAPRDRDREAQKAESRNYSRFSEPR